MKEKTSREAGGWRMLYIHTPNHVEPLNFSLPSHSPELSWEERSIYLLLNLPVLVLTGQTVRAGCTLVLLSRCTPPSSHGSAPARQSTSRGKLILLLVLVLLLVLLQFGACRYYRHLYKKDKFPQRLKWAMTRRNKHIKLLTVRWMWSSLRLTSS